MDIVHWINVNITNDMDAHDLLYEWSQNLTFSPHKKGIHTWMDECVFLYVQRHPLNLKKNKTQNPGLVYMNI